MNRETSFRTSDTLVVTDRARRRRWVIIGVVVGPRGDRGHRLHGDGRRRRQEGPRRRPEGGAGQIPTVTVIVPGRSQVGADDQRQRTARGQARPAGRHRRLRAAASCACWSMPEAGSAPARCWRWSTARSRRSRPRSSRRRSSRRAPMPRSPSRITTAPSRSRTAASCRRPKSIRRRRRATPPSRRCAWPRPSSPRRARRSAGSTSPPRQRA